VPVEVAAQIAERFQKDIVIILCWDALNEQTHTTTWGHSANDKLVAAEAGETVTAAFGADVDKKRVYEDFRLDAARWKEENDRLRTANRAAEHLINSLLAFRGGPRDDLLIEIRDAFKKRGPSMPKVAMVRMEYTISRLASGLMRVDGTLNDRTIVLVIDPPRLAARLFERARRNTTGKAVCLGGAASLSILTPKEAQP
jgi:hypothetical protein